MGKCRREVLVWTAVIAVLCVAAGALTSPLADATAFGSGRRMVRDGRGRIHLVFPGDDAAGGTEIYYTNYSNGVWSRLRNISQTPGSKSANPSIAISPPSALAVLESLFVVWEDATPCCVTDSVSGIFYAESFHSAGAQWSDPIDLRNLARTSTPSFVGQRSCYPVIATDLEENRHIAWQEDLLLDPVRSEVLYLLYNPYINSIPVVENVSESPQIPSQMPAIGTNQNGTPGSVHVVWAEGPNPQQIGGAPIVLHRQRVGGAGGGRWTAVSDVSHRDWGWSPSVVVLENGLPGEVVHVSYTGVIHIEGGVSDEGPEAMPPQLYRIFHTSGRSHGPAAWTWAPRDLVSELAGANTGGSSIAADSSGRLHVAWEFLPYDAFDRRTWEVYWVQSSNSSSAWEWPSRRLSHEDRIDSRYPNLLAKNFHNNTCGFAAVWTDGNGIPYEVVLLEKLRQCATPPPKVILSLGDCAQRESAPPGIRSTLLTIKLENDVPVKGVLFVLTDDPDYHRGLRIEAIERAAGFEAYFSELPGGGVRVVMASLSGDLIRPGEGPIARLQVSVDGGVPPGGSATLIFSNEEIADENNVLLPVESLEGVIFYGLKGDMNADEDWGLLDLLRLIDIILELPPEPTPYELWAGDMNEDCELGLVDVLLLVDKVLEE